jgi:hypothetical protein
MLRRMAGANVIGDIRLAFGWRACDVLALFPDDVAWGINSTYVPVGPMCVSLENIRTELCSWASGRTSFLRTYKYCMST